MSKPEKQFPRNLNIPKGPSQAECCYGFRCGRRVFMQSRHGIGAAVKE